MEHPQRAAPLLHRWCRRSATRCSPWRLAGARCSRAPGFTWSGAAATVWLEPTAQVKEGGLQCDLVSQLPCCFHPPPPPRCISFYSLPCVRNVGCSCIFKREIHAPAEPCCASHRGFAPILTCGSGAARGGQLGASWKCLRGGRSITRGGLRSRDRSRWQKRRDGDSALAGVWKRR